MNENLFQLFAQSAATYPDRTALHSSAGSLTYAQLDDLTSRVAAQLCDAGVEPGDRVAVMLPNVPAFAVAYYGALRAGAAVVPMNPLLKGREVAYYLRDPEVKVILAWEGCREAVDIGSDGLDVQVRYVVPGEFEASLASAPRYTEVAEREAGDTAVILYTSGTTGQPKGAELTHANLTRNIDVTVGMVPLKSDDIVIGALPLFHAFGQMVALNSVLAVGGELALVSRFEPGAVLQAIQDQGATIFMGVPTMYGAMLHHPDAASYDTSSLRVCLSGGAALPVEILHGFEKALDCTLLEGYGLSETSPVASFNRAGQQRAGSIGVPVEGIEMRIQNDNGEELPVGEVGEIVIRGHNIMKGYWRKPEATADCIDAEGWFKSGDLGRVDEDGFFYVVDRKKEMLIRGGYNVYPREIEEVLYEHPAVRECAVIGLPHAELGEEVGAAVALTSPDAATADELRAYVKERVAPYKYPRHVWFLDELPKGATNKILKREITPPADLAL